MKPEVITCPARLRDWGPWEHAEGLDHWERNRWGNRITRWWAGVAHGAGGNRRGQRFASWFHDWTQAASRRRWLRWLPHGWSQGGDYWPIHRRYMPRSCSFCGSAHPDDVTKLLAIGWTVSVCGIKTKCYIEPPKGQGDGYGAVPPVKIKTFHCTAEHIAALNAAPRPAPYLPEWQDTGALCPKCNTEMAYIKQASKMFCPKCEHAVPRYEPVS